MAFAPDKYVEIDHDLTDSLHINSFMSKGARGFIGGVNLDTGDAFACEIPIDPARFAGNRLNKENQSTVQAILTELDAGGALAARLPRAMTILPDHQIYDHLATMAATAPDMAADFKSVAGQDKAPAPARGPFCNTVNLGKIGGG